MTRLLRHAAAALAAVFMLGSLAGCAGDLDELQQWTEAKRREASRRRHLTTAVCILGAASAHAAACLLGSE